MNPVTHSEHSPDQSICGNSAPVQQVRVDLGLQASTIAIVVSLLLVIGACGVVMGLDIADRDANQRVADDRQRALELDIANLQRQYRMTELKLDDWTVVAHRAGLVLPGDYTRGPQGNPDAEAYHVRPKRK